MSFWYMVVGMSDVDLDKLRTEAIAKIEQAFPKERQTKGKAKLTRGGYPYESKDLKELLEGKSWQEVVYHPSIVYYLTDIDYMAALSDRAYDYYFPAFLVASTYQSNSWVYYSFVLEYMGRLAERSKVPRLEALVAWLEYQLEYLSTKRLRMGLQILPKDKQVQAINETLQKIRKIIDEAKSK